jgi:hypothetical protein
VVEYVTPDLGILVGNHDGVLGEVKLSFPKDQDCWMDAFRQLMAYDDDLTGWPSTDGKVNQHDVVLITEQARAVAVRKFCQRRLGGEVTFSRPFVIIQCNRSDQRKPYYFFQRIFGQLSHAELDSRLEEGVKVQMDVFVGKYSTVKLYDAEPPPPYMMQLIWSEVVVETARQDPRFERLKKRQKLDVNLSVDEIAIRLREGFSFRAFQEPDDDRGPAVPARTWVTAALEQLVSLKDAEWVDSEKRSIRVLFQKYEDVLGHFIQACSDLDSQHGKKERRLFD